MIVGRNDTTFFLLEDDEDDDGWVGQWEGGMSLSLSQSFLIDLVIV
jgi:hypothetical protein